LNLAENGLAIPAETIRLRLVRRSAAFASPAEPQEERNSTPVESELSAVVPGPSDIALGGAVTSRTIASSMVQTELPDDGTDKIPVRLSGGRRAWLIIPTPFFESDKARLKAQIDLLLSEDELNQA
jgi:hypothetical protein